MSNDISIQRQLDATQYITMVSVGILYYDYCLTWPMEVDRFWSLPKITWASFFFYTNRYVSLFGHLPVLFVSFWSTADPMDKLVTCRRFSSYRRVFAVVVQIAAGILQIIRTYAFYERNPWVLGSLTIVASGAIAFGGWSVVAGKHHTEAITFMPRLGCSASVSAADGIRLAAAWGGGLVWEMSILILTLYRSLAFGRTGGNRTLVNILLRDGSVYFAVIVISILTNVLTFVVSPPILKGCVTTLTNVLSATLISRLMLNLRDPKITSRQRHATATTTGDDAFVSTIVDIDTSTRKGSENRGGVDGAGEEEIRPGAIELEERNKTQPERLRTGP